MTTIIVVILGDHVLLLVRSVLLHRMIGRIEDHYDTNIVTKGGANQEVDREMEVGDREAEVDIRGMEIEG